MHIVWSGVFITLGGLVFLLALLGFAVYYFLRRMR